MGAEIKSDLRTVALIAGWTPASKATKKKSLTFAMLFNAFESSPWGESEPWGLSLEWFKIAHREKNKIK